MQIKQVKYFFSYLKKYIPHECFLLLLLLLSSAAALASPYILKVIIDTVFPSGDTRMLVWILGIYLAISVGRLVTTYFSNYLFEWVSNHVMKDLRIKVFTHLVRLPMSFFDKQKSGDIIHRINSEVNSVQNILTSSTIQVINSACLIIGLCVVLGILNLKLFLIALAILPFIFLNTLYFQPKIRANIRSGRQKDSEILSFLMERFRNIKLLKSYMNYDWEKTQLGQLVDQQIEINLKNVKLSATTKNISLFFTLCIPITILYLGGRDVMAGTMTVGSLVAFIQYINRLFDPMRNLMGVYFDMVRASVSMDRIYDIIALTPETQNGKPVTGKGDIELQGVSFSYGSLPVLENIDLALKEGRKYAIVGESGCGKSTVLSLLCRFYQPDSGTIRYGGQDIQSFDLKAWRDSISLISQDNHLFHGTIASNIRYAREDASIQEVAGVCSTCQIDNHISTMDARYDSVVGDQGVTLSGGQRQRIALARSLLRETGIILLDEATSAIDAKTEYEILKNIFRLNEQKTIIIVSHRLDSIKDVDQIICMDNGRIVETGTHEQLMAARGHYWTLYTKQVG